MDWFGIRIGCAGWAIPRRYADQFPPEGTQLERYAERFHAPEVNSSFYRSRQPATYARWAACVAERFQFAVKVPRRVTHEQCLTANAPLDRFLSEALALGAKLGPCLLQLPPSLAFDAAIAGVFFAALRERFAGGTVC